MGAYRCFLITERGRMPRVVEIVAGAEGDAWNAVRAVIGAEIWRVGSGNGWVSPAMWRTDDGWVTVTRHELVILPDRGADPLTLGVPDPDTVVPLAGATWAELDAYRHGEKAVA